MIHLHYLVGMYYYYYFETMVEGHDLNIEIQYGLETRSDTFWWVHTMQLMD